MAEEPNPNHQEIIKLEGTAQDESKLTQIGRVDAENFHLNAQQVQFLVHLESSTKVESPGVLKAGNPGKSLAYWQGRTTEIAQIQQWLTDNNTFLIGIEGIGGTGKSTLATKIYDEIAGFPKRFWADVSNGASFSDLARQVLTQFGFHIPEKEAQLVDALVNCLRSGQFLLIIDNLESLLQPDRQWGSLFYGDFFQTWVESGSNSKVLVTTRERPELKGFQWLSLRGLQVEEGVALLTALGIKGDLKEFVELVDGHPLLLRLVADLLKEEYSQDPDLSRLVDLGLGNLRQLLTDSQVVGVHRRENVGMVLVLDASFNRLSELQKALLLNISVYRGAIESAAAVVMLPGYSAAEIEGELRNIVKRSLLVEKLNGKRRFGFQPVVWEYVRYQAGDQSEAHQRAIDYYGSIAKQPPWTTKDDVKEYLEIFDHFYQLQDYNSAFDALEGCYDFLSLRGYYIDLVELYGQLVSKWAEIGDRGNWKYGNSLVLLGNSYKSLGQYQQAIEFFQQSLEIFREISHRLGEANSLNNLGSAYRSLAQYQQAINFYQQSLEIYREISHRNGEGKSLNNLGNVYHSLGQYQRAIEFFQQSLEIKRERSDRNGEGKSLNNLGNVYNSLGEYQRAINFHQQSLEIKRERSDRNGEAASLNNLGVAYRSLGEYQRAIDFHQQSLEISKEIGDRNEEANCLGNLGSAYGSLRQYQRAIDFHQQSLEISKEIGDRNGEAVSLCYLGAAYLCLREYQRAIEFCQQSLEIAREIGNRYEEAGSLNCLGGAYHFLGEYQRAIEFCQQSLEIARDIGDHNHEANSLYILSKAHRRLKQHKLARHFHQQYLKIKKEISDRNSESLPLINSGLAYLFLGEYQKAIDFYQQSLEKSREIGDRKSEGNSLIGLGNTYKSLGQHQRGIEFYQQSLDIAREIGDRKAESTSLDYLGSAYSSQEQYQQAIEFYQQSLEISREIGDRNGECSSLSHLGDVYSSLGQHKRARGFFKQSSKIRKEIIGDSLWLRLISFPCLLIGAILGLIAAIGIILLHLWRSMRSQSRR
ncbi:tetratricopeptide repeat protein [Anabaena minutissima FACHB-250]|nr:tetratricopeptide repeat protein [Anabaena minutissima FACHB-250]